MQLPLKALPAERGEQLWSVQGRGGTPALSVLEYLFLDTYLDRILLFSLVQAIDCIPYLNVQIFCFRSHVAAGSSRCQEWTGFLECWAQWSRGLAALSWGLEIRSQCPQSSGPRKEEMEGGRKEGRTERKKEGKEHWRAGASSEVLWSYLDVSFDIRYLILSVLLWDKAVPSHVCPQRDALHLPQALRQWVSQPNWNIKNLAKSFSFLFSLNWVPLVICYHNRNRNNTRQSLGPQSVSW